MLLAATYPRPQNSLSPLPAAATLSIDFAGAGAGRLGSRPPPSPPPPSPPPPSPSLPTGVLLDDGGDNVTAEEGGGYYAFLLLLLPIMCVGYVCARFPGKVGLYFRYHFSHSNPHVLAFYMPKEAREEMRIALFKGDPLSDDKQQVLLEGGAAEAGDVDSTAPVQPPPAVPVNKASARVVNRPDDGDDGILDEPSAVSTSKTIERI